MRFKQMLPSTLGLLAVLCVTPFAAAHDFWLLPASFRLSEPGPVTLEAVNGHALHGETVPWRASHIQSYTVVHPDGTRSEVLGRDGMPQGVVRLETPGVHRAVYESTYTPLMLKADRFEQYLSEEGLGHIIDERRDRGESAMPGRELYARAAKSLIVVEPTNDDAGNTADRIDTPIGLPVEICLAESTMPTERDTVRLRLLRDGKPLADSALRAYAESSPSTMLELRTDSNGETMLELHADGAWLITAIHMDRVESDPDADWRSVWASLTFYVAPHDG